MTDVEQIAKRLTEKARDTLLAIHPTAFDGFHLDYGEGHAPYTALFKAGLLNKWKPAGMHTIYSVPDLGLAVRDYLLEQSKCRMQPSKQRTLPMKDDLIERLRDNAELWDAGMCDSETMGDDMRQAADTLKRYREALDKSEEERLQFKRWWTQERARNEALQTDWTP